MNYTLFIGIQNIVRASLNEQCLQHGIDNLSPVLF